MTTRIEKASRLATTSFSKSVLRAGRVTSQYSCRLEKLTIVEVDHSHAGSPSSRSCSDSYCFSPTNT